MIFDENLSVSAGLTALASREPMSRGEPHGLVRSETFLSHTEMPYRLMPDVCLSRLGAKLWPPAPLGWRPLLRQPLRTARMWSGSRRWCPPSIHQGRDGPHRAEAAPVQRVPRHEQAAHMSARQAPDLDATVTADRAAQGPVASTCSGGRDDRG